MSIQLYWGSGSPFAWRVMLALEVKKLPYESKLLEFSKGDNKSAEYLRLNPRGKVPTLKDGDFVLYESLAIMAYLDRKYPDPPLFGSTPEETGLIWRTLAECESYLVPAGDKVVRPMFFGKGLDKVEEIEQAAQIVRRELKALDEHLIQAQWLVGAKISAADIACSRSFSCFCAQLPRKPPGHLIWAGLRLRRDSQISPHGCAASKSCRITTARIRRTGGRH